MHRNKTKVEMGRGRAGQLLVTGINAAWNNNQPFRHIDSFVRSHSLDAKKFGNWPPVANDDYFLFSTLFNSIDNAFTTSIVPAAG
jgi:hypothetical protein